MKKKIYAKSILPFLAAISITYSANSQSAPNLNTNVDWDSDPVVPAAQSGYSTVFEIENAFNNARRAEEIQKSIPTNTLGTLVFPIDWATYTPHQKAFFLINKERACRGGVDYDGAGGIDPVLGLAIDDIESQLNTVAQNHADWLVTNNLFSHTGVNNSSPFTRIRAAFGLNTCSEFLSRGENIAFFGSTYPTITAAVERAVYNWIYRDSGASWGHRAAALLQDKDLAGVSNNGFKNNYGSGLSEGMMGLGIAGANNNTYNPISGTINRGEVVVLVIMDPVTDATSTVNNCNYVTAAALPIELAQFTVVQNNETILLNWKTLTEQNNSYFIIERASEEKEFEPIGKIAAWGNSNTERSYSFLDTKTKSGTYYYRLVQYDNDGTSSVSSIRTIRFFEKLNLTTYVTNQDLRLSFNSSHRNYGNYTISNVNGIIFEKGEINVESGFNQINLNMNNLSAGMYLLSLEINGTKEINKFVWVE
jgi:uncharacterized protein YkwD